MFRLVRFADIYERGDHIGGGGVKCARRERETKGKTGFMSLIYRPFDFAGVKPTLS